MLRRIKAEVLPLKNVNIIMDGINFGTPKKFIRTIFSISRISDPVMAEKEARAIDHIYRLLNRGFDLQRLGNIVPFGNPTAPNNEAYDPYIRNAIFGKNNDPNLIMFLKEASKYPMINIPEQNKLAKQAKEGNIEARNLLITSNLRLVISIARNFTGRGAPMLELIQWGCQGFDHAIKKFDPEVNDNFVSYAVIWIRQQISYNLREKSRTVRLPQNRVDTVRQVQKIIGKLQQKLERNPSIEEIAVTAGIPVNEVEEAIILYDGALSLDAPYNDNKVKDNSNALVLADHLEDEKIPPPDKGTYDQALRDDLKKGMQSLNGLEREVIELYYGTNGDPGWTQKEIGEKINKDTHQVRVIRIRALTKLRSPLREHRPGI